MKTFVFDPDLVLFESFDQKQFIKTTPDGLR
jgi:hypothetical protein